MTEKHLARAHVLGILPTGAGKSLCYQLPALMRYEATGALTVVISPLVALMADQVTAMRRQGITCATTINGLISMPERAEALAHIRFGDAGIVLVAPEQLRNRSFRKAIAGRRIGAWVVDEAHCLSKWGHDFRPDYRYVARYIAEHHGQDSVPILCLTATAKHDVVDDIGEHFEQTLQSRLEVVDGGAERTNLEFVVMPTSASQRIEHIHRALNGALERERSGGAIVYCTTKRSTEETAQALADRGLAAEHFHGVASNDMRITVFVHARVENASTRRLALAQELEQALIAELREEASDQEINEWTPLALRFLAQRLREKGMSNPLPERLVRILRSISADGRDQPDAKRSIEIRARDMETIEVRLRRNWKAIERIARDLGSRRAEAPASALGAHGMLR